MTYVPGQAVFDAAQGQQPQGHGQLMLLVLVECVVRAQLFLAGGGGKTGHVCGTEQEYPPISEQELTS